MADIDRIAREGVNAHARYITNPLVVDPDAYTALCRAVIERGERIRELAAELDAQIARVRRYEETLTHRQRRVAHPDGTYTFEMDVERVGDLWNKLDAALRGKETT